MTVLAVLTTTFAFLDANPTETIVMSVKQEADDDGATQSFEATFDGYVAQNAARWYTGDSVPTLGDVRGDIVLLRRFDVTCRRRIHRVGSRNEVGGDHLPVR